MEELYWVKNKQKPKNFSSISPTRNNSASSGPLDRFISKQKKSFNITQGK
jgi:hypothetical protein